MTNLKLHFLFQQTHQGLRLKQWLARAQNAWLTPIAARRPNYLTDDWIDENTTYEWQEWGQSSRYTTLLPTTSLVARHADKAAFLVGAYLRMSQPRDLVGRPP